MLTRVLKMCRWLAAQVEGLAGNRAALIDALSPLGSSSIVGGEGAIYLFAKLPDGEYRALS